MKIQCVSTTNNKQQTKVLWPSGLRRLTQDQLSSDAQVRTLLAPNLIRTFYSNNFENSFLRSYTLSVRGFESRLRHQNWRSDRVVKVAFFLKEMSVTKNNADVGLAQMEERRANNSEAIGSSPIPHI